MPTKEIPMYTYTIQIAITSQQAVELSIYWKFELQRLIMIYIRNTYHGMHATQGVRRLVMVRSSTPR